MGLYNNDSLRDKPKEYPVSGDDVADKIAGFALIYLAPLIRIVVYSSTEHNTPLTALICKCSQKTINRLISDLSVKSNGNIIWLKLDGLVMNNVTKPSSNKLEHIRSVVELIKPFLPRYGGNPHQIDVSMEELDNTLKVLKKIAVLYHLHKG
jgi:hypothetical protein